VLDACCYARSQLGNSISQVASEDNDVHPHVDGGDVNPGSDSVLGSGRYPEADAGGRSGPRLRANATNRTGCCSDGWARWWSCATSRERSVASKSTEPAPTSHSPVLRARWPGRKRAAGPDRVPWLPAACPLALLTAGVLAVGVRSRHPRTDQHPSGAQVRARTDRGAGTPRPPSTVSMWRSRRDQRSRMVLAAGAAGDSGTVTRYPVQRGRDRPFQSLPHSCSCRRGPMAIAVFWDDYRCRVGNHRHARRRRITEIPDNKRSQRPLPGS
jgi:hypothetical protein